MITEADDIAAALDDAARVWPEFRDQRGKLLYRLIAEGHKAIHEEHARAVARRREAIKATTGFMGDTGADDGLNSTEFVRQLRDTDWPE